jgi:ferredoxin-type protein NapG
MREDTPLNRRRFFREGLRELLRPFGSAIEPIEAAARALGSLDEKSPPPLPRRVELKLWLRPPGAKPEKEFLDSCSRCGDCVRICPAQCIRIDVAGVRGNGAPFIDVDAMPCVLCDGLKCTHVCPTGALSPVEDVTHVDMGTAVWHEDLCLRSRGEGCTVCIDQCPIGAKALELVEGKVTVHEADCAGCGVCQHYCPTSPKSITVNPRPA